MARHVGLFGGSFNPPHLGHLIVAETVREQCDFNGMLWMVSGQPPHKEGGDVAPAEHRLAMTRLATAGHAAFEVSDLEVRKEGLSYTVETLRALQEAQPDVQLHLVVGGDSLRDFGSWHRPDEIVERVPLVAYRRAGAEHAEVEMRFRDRVHVVDAPLIDISATDVRARCMEGRSIRYLVPEAVRTYIDEHGLYGA